jgi:thymidine kinase
MPSFRNNLESRVLTKNKIWEFVIFTGPMFSSKTSRLLAAVERHKIRGSKVLSFKPMIDDRYAQTSIVTHSGGSLSAISVSNGAEIFEIAESEKASVIAVDEAFMIEGCADSLISLFRKGFSVYVSSIELSSNLKPFAEIERMFAYATKIEKCSAVCLHCGGDAQLTFRKQESQEEVSVGGADSYEPVCWNCHPLVQK